MAGEHAQRVVELFAGTPLQTIVLDGSPVAASALKMTYAAWSKGTAAMLLAIRATARAAGVEDELIAEWERSQPDPPGFHEAAAEVFRDSPRPSA